ncbi:MAG: nucleotidyltransferase family protein [Thermoleophilaceae bacterium]
MRSDLPSLARRIGADDRTLRRAIQRGCVRAGRPGPRRLDLDGEEASYLESHWGLLASLTDVLRTERGVRLAVMFGSVARGDEEPGSDLDVLVDTDGDLASFARLRRRLAAAAGRPIQLTTLGDARQSALLIADVVEDGRVLVDRNGSWSGWVARLPELRELAAREERQLDARARAAFAYYSRPRA